ncbi:ParA family protein [Streptomyces sp. H10-C2]|uniref:ParA family protein n=1 Tax=unclassified Streptomyces TaxID=2593676 RepID=UPI0024BB291D|nr:MULTISPECIES: ParA family protein [unclassified Streptomyces]MDJ0345906.1 ParA family protein [Streptomyces sp. PH10-H1]MDJ0374755.1 ParA family protein [Streptomyces sp. H10-C2]
MWIGVGRSTGGVGGTTAALELAYAASRRRKGRRLRRVAFIDLNPSAEATACLEPWERRGGIKDVLAADDPVPLRDVLVPTAWQRVYLAPAERTLTNRAADLLPATIDVLRRARLSGDVADLVDDVILDLPSGSGKLTTAGMLGAEHLLIATRASLWAAQGAEETRYAATRIQKAGNPELRIDGYVVSQYEETSEARRVLELMQSRYGILAVNKIPRNVLVRESIESYHTPCRLFGSDELISIADGYQDIYDRLLKKGGPLDGE